MTRRRHRTRGGDDPGQHALSVSCGYRRTDDVEAASLNTYVRFDA